MFGWIRFSLIIKKNPVLRVLGKDQSSGKELLAWNTLDKILIRLIPAREDLESGRKLKIKEPFVVQDEWTIQLPIKKEGKFSIEF